MLILFDLASAYGPWGSIIALLVWSLVWGGAVWMVAWWLRLVGIHKSTVIAQVKIVWFLAGVVLMLDLIFVPFTLFVLHGAMGGALAIIIVQTRVYLVRTTTPKGALRETYDSTGGTRSENRNRDIPF